MMNSTATLFTMDLYQPFLKPKASEAELVNVGRIVGLIAILIAVLVAQPLLGGQEQIFQFIQKYTGYVSPGVVVLFLFGLFWKRTTATAALWSALASVPLSIANDLAFPEMPFLDQMGVVFLGLCGLIVGISYTSRPHPEKAIRLEKALFRTSNTFNVLAMGVVLILGALYALFW